MSFNTVSTYFRSQILEQSFNLKFYRSICIPKCDILINSVWIHMAGDGFIEIYAYSVNVLGLNPL